MQDMTNKFLEAGGDKIPGNKFAGKRITMATLLEIANDQGGNNEIPKTKISS